ncbi:MAG: hypothetical protein ACJAT1_002327 [Marivirga sp.]|jgi:hypothetical protein
MSYLQTYLYMAQEVGKGLGRGEVLQSKVQEGSKVL